MPNRRRNADGSLSYTPTADEKAQGETQYTVKHLKRDMKRALERIDALEVKVAQLLEIHKEAN